MSEELTNLVSDNELKKVCGNSNFGYTPREVLKLTLLKRASLYHCGFTAIQICRELGLLTPKTHSLTNKGGAYLWEAFSGGSNF